MVARSRSAASSGQHLTVLREHRVELGERHAGFDGDRLVFGRVVDDLVERRRADHGVERARRVAQLELRAAADERERLALAVQLAHGFRELVECCAASRCRAA